MVEDQMGFKNEVHTMLDEEGILTTDIRSV